MTKPLVTVLIDTYNHERFIEKAIVSVLEQDFPSDKMEILVVDDGSTDRTPEIVREIRAAPAPDPKSQRRPSLGIQRWASPRHKAKSLPSWTATTGGCPPNCEKCQTSSRRIPAWARWATATTKLTWSAPSNELVVPERTMRS